MLEERSPAQRAESRRVDGMRNQIEFGDMKFERNIGNKAVRFPIRELCECSSAAEEGPKGKGGRG